jgi:hypothetical protein
MGQGRIDAPFTSLACRSRVTYETFSLALPFLHVGQRDEFMSRNYLYAFIALILSALASAPAHATRNCLKDQKAYKLAGDTIEWSMAISPGADCIQGLRWSTMQIYGVWVLEKPKGGELVLVGPGFRYFARPDFSGTDRFTLVVVGKNRHDEGFSTIDITISRSDAAPPASSASQLGSEAAPKVADAAVHR